MVVYGDYQVYSRDQSTCCEEAFDDFVWKRCGYFFLWGGLHVGETDVCVEKDLKLKNCLNCSREDLGLERMTHEISTLNFQGGATV